MHSLKEQLEIYFNENWVLTPVQYQGARFDQPTDKTWIYISFVPIDRAVYGFDGGNGRKMDTAMLRVSSYSSNPLKSLEIDDAVRAFLECWELPFNDCQVQEGVPDGLGIVDLGNGMFETISNYLMNSYN